MNKAFYSKDFKLGVLGVGQLGRMLIQEAVNYNVSIHCMDPDQHAPCKDLATSFIVGDLKNYDDVMAFGKDKDVVTIEIEHVNVDALEDLEKSGIKVYPQPSVLRMVQDKGAQKEFYRSNNIPTADFELVKDKAEATSFVDSFPYMMKLRKGGYDGKGVTPLRTEADLDNAFDAPCVLESFVDFEAELSVIVSRNPQGEIKTFPTVAMEFNKEANLVEFLFSPAEVSEAIETKAQEVAKRVAEKSGVVGLLAVELFLTKSGDILVNEVAPRPHNSGHHTIEANITSQYEQHLRAILGMPLGATDIIQPGVMVNVLGEKDHTGDAEYVGLDDIVRIPGVYVHLYGKKTTKPFRKMGHVTVMNADLGQAKEYAQTVKEILKVVSADN